MHRIDTAGKAVDKFGAGKHGFSDGSELGLQEATLLVADYYDSLQEGPVRVVEGAGLALEKGNHDQLLQAIKIIAAYDIPFHAGFDGSGEAVDLVAQRYGMLIATRAAVFNGIVGAVLTAPTGAVIQVDIKKNGVSVFDVKPTVAIAATVLAGAVFTGGSFTVAPGDLIHFHVLQVGSGVKGKGLHIGLQGRRA